MMCTHVVIPHTDNDVHTCGYTTHRQWCAYMWSYHTLTMMCTHVVIPHMDNDSHTSGYTTHRQWCAHMWLYHTLTMICTHVVIPHTDNDAHTCGHTTHRQQSTCLWQQNWNKIYYSGWLWDSFTPESMFSVQTWMFEYGRKRLISLEVLIAIIVHVFSHSEGPQVASPRYQILCSLLKTWRFIKKTASFIWLRMWALSLWLCQEFTCWLLSPHL